MTLRKGSRDYFYKAIDNHFPKTKEKYQTLFGERYECFSPNYQELKNRFRTLTTKFGITAKMRFYNPPKYEQQTIFNIS
jgi:hypothetical protein